MSGLTMTSGHGRWTERGGRWLCLVIVAEIIFDFPVSSLDATAAATSSTTTADLDGGMDSKKRKHEDNLPSLITYHTPDRTFDRLFKGEHTSHFPTSSCDR